MTFFALFQQAQPQGPPAYFNIIFLAGMGLMFYFLMIRPQSKQRKAMEERLSKLKSGDEVVLHGGLYAVIDRVEEKHVYLKLGNGIVKARRTAVAQLATEPEQQN